METETDSTKKGLRIISGILAGITLLLVIFRTIAIVQANLFDTGDTFTHVLRIIFPLSLSLLFGYIAWKGSLPFSN